jgi:hypothetical protein
MLPYRWRAKAGIGQATVTEEGCPDSRNAKRGYGGRRVWDGERPPEGVDDEGKAMIET